MATVRRILRILGACGAAFGALGIALLAYRPLWIEPRTPFESSAYRAPWGLERELILPERTARIVFVVDQPGGREPVWAAVDELVRIASKYGERPAVWVRPGEPGAPKGHWRTDDEYELSAPLDPTASVVFVRFTGTAQGAYGRTSRARVTGAGEERYLPLIRVAQDTLARVSVLWLTRDHLESATLIHEYGHVLGLGRNPDHCQAFGGGHCVNPECVVASPTLRKILYGLWYAGLTFRRYDDYCAACQSDLARARELWLHGTPIPDARRPTPDELAGRSGWASRFRERDFRDGGRAEGLILLGKAGMPITIEWLRRLPGATEGSAAPEQVTPRAYADWIAKTIVLREASAREKPGGGVRDSGWKMGDHSAEMLAWWDREGEKFMAGDDWELPPSVFVKSARPVQPVRPALPP